MVSSGLIETKAKLSPPSHRYIIGHTCCLCSSLERKAPDMKRLSRPLRSSLRREVRRGRRASREASVILLPGRAKLSNLEPKHRPTWRVRMTERDSQDTWGERDRKKKWWEFKEGLTKQVGVKQICKQRWQEDRERAGDAVYFTTCCLHAIKMAYGQCVMVITLPNLLK